MKKGLYIFHLWVATFAMLLSTVVMHHHHYRQICTVIEKCAEDNNLNDEHTQHRENEQEGCRIHQMHHFVINAKVVKDIQKHISDAGNMLLAVLPDSMRLPADCGLVSVEWQETTESLPLGFSSNPPLRGPPQLSLL